MPNWCQNSITIPKIYKKAFLRKFTKRYFSSEGITAIRVDFNRILRMPTDLPEVFQHKWLTESWGSVYNANKTVLFVHEDSDELEITFDTAWSPASQKLVEQIAKRLHCNVEHVWLECCQESYGIRKFIFDDGENHDEPELFFIQEAEDNEDTFETIVTRFHGYSEYAEELMERYRNGEIQ